MKKEMHNRLMEIRERARRNDAEEKWITINGAHVQLGEGGELKGKAGQKISESGLREATSGNIPKQISSLMGKDTKKITMKDTRSAAKEYKGEYQKALERVKNGEDPWEVRKEFENRYHKKMKGKMLELEKNGNKSNMEGRVAISDAEDFLNNNWGCDLNKIAW